MSSLPIRVGPNSSHGMAEASQADARTLRPEEVLVRVEASRLRPSATNGRAGCVLEGDHHPRPDRAFAGAVEALGSSNTRWQIGQRVAIGLPVLGSERIDHGAVPSSPASASVKSIDGTRLDPTHLIVGVDELLAVPSEIEALSGAEVLSVCIATSSALEKSIARAGDWVAVLGLCATGLIGVQVARGLGCRVAAISSSSDRLEAARRLGASVCIDMARQAPVGALAALGGATLILTTASNLSVLPDVVEALRDRGRILVLRPSGEVLEMSGFAMRPSSRRCSRSPSVDVDVDDGFALSLAASLSSDLGSSSEDQTQRSNRRQDSLDSSNDPSRKS